jgi:hypothetical protein
VTKRNSCFFGDLVNIYSRKGSLSDAYTADKNGKNAQSSLMAVKKKR